MPATARFALKMDADEKNLVSRAAALTGTTMAGFVRAAAKENAVALLDFPEIHQNLRPGDRQGVADAPIHRRLGAVGVGTAG